MGVQIPPHPILCHSEKCTEKKLLMWWETFFHCLDPLRLPHHHQTLGLSSGTWGQIIVCQLPVKAACQTTLWRVNLYTNMFVKQLRTGQCSGWCWGLAGIWPLHLYPWPWYRPAREETWLQSVGAVELNLGSRWTSANFHSEAVTEV